MKKTISKNKEVKEPNYILFYLISMIISLIAHYFLLSKTNLHPTLQVFISLLIFTLFLGGISMLDERKIKK